MCRMGGYGAGTASPPPSDFTSEVDLSSLQSMPPSSDFPCAEDNWREGKEAPVQIEELESDDPYNEQLKKVEILKDPSMSEECSHYTVSHGFECVPYYQCDEDGVILTDGAGLIDIRYPVNFNQFTYHNVK